MNLQRNIIPILCIILLFFGCTGNNKLKDVPDDITLTEQPMHLSYYFPSREEFGTLQDGTYIGSIKSQLDSGEIKIVVKNNRIVDFTINNLLMADYVTQKGLNDDVTNGMPQRFLEAQSPQVDAVTGATGSSHVLKICFTRALWQAAGKEDPMLQYLPENLR